LAHSAVVRLRTGDGKMRHPAWRGLRPDKTPAQTSRVTVPAETIEGALQSPDGSWQVQVVRRGAVTSYRITHDDDVIDWLPEITDVEDILTSAGIPMQDLQPVPDAPAAEPADVTPRPHDARGDSSPPGGVAVSELKRREVPPSGAAHG
jgi:hypothetical protein